ncbi:MAG: polyprenol monophosphomannose synthase [Candidatus Riflebacteria bacterium]|nr:polyprenol monophosphomannose synthase [Candidatus Riflebacteria bacterium]
MVTKFQKRIIVFMPTYNEAGNMEKIIGEILSLECKPDVLVIDDQSPDGTGQIVEKIAEHDPRVHFVSRPAPRGRGLAGRDGFTWFQNHPEYDELVEMDADFSHHPRFIPGLVAALCDSDVVIGSRFAPGGGETGRPFSRQLISKFANKYLSIILKTSVKDCTSGYRLFTQKALAGIDFSKYESVGPTIVTELLFDLVRRKRKIAESPILFEERAWGDSKLSWKILLRSLIFPLKMRFKKLLS